MADWIILLSISFFVGNRRYPLSHFLQYLLMPDLTDIHCNPITEHQAVVRFALHQRHGMSVRPFHTELCP